MRSTCLKAAMVRIVLVTSLAAMPVMASGALAQGASQSTPQPSAAATQAVQSAISTATSASALSNNITRLLLNNPGRASELMVAIQVVVVNASSVGLIAAIGAGVGVAVALAGPASPLGQQLKAAADAVTAAAGAAGAIFASAASSAQLAASAGDRPPPPGVPPAGTLAGVLASFDSGLPVNETGTLSQN
jgi:hypothetical protein